MHFRKPFLFVAALTLAAAPSLVQAADPPNPDLTATKQTIQDVRAVGTAMWSWYKDNQAPHRSEDSHKRAEAQDTTSTDISAIPVISREDLTKILVPKYIASIPEHDGWGHPYEFHLETRNAEATRVMGLRSTGKDGRYSGTVYAVGGFDTNDFSQDIVWVDGYFARWPERKQQQP